MLSKAFSKSMKSRRPGICFVLAYLMVLSISLIFSPVVLFFRKPIWSLLMIFSRTFLMQFASDLAAILQSQLRWVIGLQFFRRLPGLFFLGTRVIRPLLCVIDKCPFVQLELRAFSKKGFTQSQKPYKIPLEAPQCLDFYLKPSFLSSLNTCLLYTSPSPRD